MKRKEEEELIAQVVADDKDPDAWEDDPAPTLTRKTLGAQVTLRLDPDRADLVRQIAARRQVGYTSLIRMWVDERIEQEGATRRPLPELSWAGHVEFEADTDSVRMSGDGRLLPK